MIDVTTAKEYIEKLEQKARLKKSTSLIDAEIKKLDAKLTEEMKENELTELVVDELKLTKVIDENFSLTGESTGQVWDDEKGKWFAWLKENGNEALIKESVHSKTRNAFLKSRRTEGLDIPDFIKIGLWEHIKVNKTEIERRVENESGKPGVVTE